MSDTLYTPPARPLLVSTTRAKQLLGFGNTKFWALVKAGKIEMTDAIGPRRMVVYASLERLAQPAKIAA